MKNRKTHMMGQVFLVSPHIAEIEAAHAIGKNVLEIGPGQGILTRALLRNARLVVGVEKDRGLYSALKMSIASKKLKLLHMDFFDATDEELQLGKVDIVISNVPYSLSSRIIGWLAEKRMQAVLCLQKEFVDHMLAEPDTREYSNISVTTALCFRVTKIMEVGRNNFRPVPLVDSSIIYMKPLHGMPGREELKIIAAMMQHKKKTVRNALIDSSWSLGIEKGEMVKIADAVRNNGGRVFKLAPSELLELSREVIKRANIPINSV